MELNEEKVAALAGELRFSLSEEEIASSLSYLKTLLEFLDPIAKEGGSAPALNVMELDFEEASLREDAPRSSDIRPEDNAPAFEMHHFVTPLVK